MSGGGRRRKWEHDEEGRLTYTLSVGIFDSFRGNLRPVLKSGRPIRRRPRGMNDVGGVESKLTEWPERRIRLARALYLSSHLLD